MDKELRGLVIEIISLAIMLVIIVPICADASSRYRVQKEALLSGVGTNIDISYDGDSKKVTVYSIYDEPVRINLVLKINKVVNEYDVYFDNEVYELDKLEHFEDDNYRYYRLGIYEIDAYREFSFKICAKGDIYSEEDIMYSFVTEGLM